MEDIRTTISNLTKSIGKTSGDLIKTTKLSMEVSTEEGNLRDAYIKIGRKVCEIYEYGGSLGKHFDEEYADVKEIEGRLDRVREELDMAKGTKTCTKCGKTAPRSAEYCPKCGAPMQDGTEPAKISPPRPFADPEPAPEAAPEAPASKTCPVCGMKNNAADKFCLGCGRVI